MRILFSYPCIVGVMLSDGNLTTMSFACGDTVAVVGAVCATEAVSHQDFVMEDGSVLRNVPLSVVCVEPCKEYTS